MITGGSVESFLCKRISKQINKTKTNISPTSANYYKSNWIMIAVHNDLKSELFFLIGVFTSVCVCIHRFEGLCLLSVLVKDGSSDLFEQHCLSWLRSLQQVIQVSQTHQNKLENYFGCCLFFFFSFFNINIPALLCLSLMPQVRLSSQL